MVASLTLSACSVFQDQTADNSPRVGSEKEINSTGNTGTATRNAVKNALLARKDVNGFGVEVVVRPGEVILTGVVPDEKQKQLAMEVAKQHVPPGTKVVSQLSTKPSRDLTPVSTSPMQGNRDSFPQANDNDQER